MSKLGSAFSRFVAAVREDHAMMQHYHDRYQSTDHAGSLTKDLVQRVGFQMMAAYRTMRFFHEAGVPVAPKLASRAIRLVYGSDIHWEAEFAPGVVIVHGMGMAISRSAKVGRGSILMQNVTLAESTNPATGEVGGPNIRENVHVGPGSALIGPIEIGADSKILANSTLVQSVPARSRVEGAAPRVVPRSKKMGDSST